MKKPPAQTLAQRKRHSAPKPDVAVEARIRVRLLAQAQAARRHAYAPYSRFRVGAAVLDERDRIHVGCNVENASYGLTICAERNAIAAAAVAGAKRIRAVAVVTASRPPARPCGACLQALAEWGSRDLLLLLATPGAASGGKLAQTAKTTPRTTPRTRRPTTAQPRARRASSSARPALAPSEERRLIQLLPETFRLRH